LFRYFRDPHHFADFSAEPRLCGICGRMGPGYRGSWFSGGERALDHVCEECLATGRLEAAGVSANEPGVLGALREGRWKLTGDLVVDEARVGELEFRTPPIPRWQDWSWPRHCDDFACYVKEAGAADFDELAGQADGRTFLRQTLERAEELPDEWDYDLYDVIREDSPADLSEQYDLTAYLFQCRVCGQYLTVTDAS
jgi:uncharacterized protein CbrC (UPF0167 family)